MLNPYPILLATLFLPQAGLAQEFLCRQDFSCQGFEALVEDLEARRGADTFEARLACESGPDLAPAARLRLPEGEAEGRFRYLQLDVPLRREAESSQSLYMTMQPGADLPSVLMHFDLAEQDMTTTRITRNGPTLARFTCEEAR